MIKKVISALILPPTGPVLLAFMGLWVSRKRPIVGLALTVFSLSSLLILSIPVTGNALLQSIESLPPISANQLKEIEAIVILGGGTDNSSPEFQTNPSVGRWTLQRLRYGAYLQQLTGKPILVTGGAPFAGRPDGEAMAETLTRDFHAKTVWIEGQSKDTTQNAEFSAAILQPKGIKTIAVVSQAWHLPRAIALFQSQGLNAIPAPTGFTTVEDPYLRWLPSASGLDKSAIALKEYLGRLALLMQTN